MGNPLYGCGYRNNEVTFGGRIQEFGCRYELSGQRILITIITNSPLMQAPVLLVRSRRDLDRQVIKSDSARLIIPEIDFEIPAGTQRGEISTVEGFLSRAAKVLIVLTEIEIALRPSFV